MPTTPIPIPAPGLPLPDPDDKLTFTPRKLEDLRWTREDAVPGMEALATVTYDNAVESQTAAAAATTNGAAQVALATAAANAAATSAVTAVNAPGTSGTSTTSLAVGPGPLSLATQAGKNWVPGQVVTIARTSAPDSIRMSGPITGYSGTTLAVKVDSFLGAGTFTDWTVSLGTAAAPKSFPIQLIGANTTAVPGVHYLFTAGGITLTLPTSWTKDDAIEWSVVAGLTSFPVVDFGSTKLRSQSPGSMSITNSRRTYRVQHTGNSTYGLQ